MKKSNLTFIFCLTVFFLSAQDITISFQPKADTVLIDSIKVTNLRTNQVVTLSGSESLVLVKTTTSINPLLDNLEKGTIYPNPTDENATFSFSMDKNQQVELRLYNASGQLLNQNRQYLAQGTHRFDLKFPITGLYFLSVFKSDGPASFKAVYTGRKTQTSSIEYAGSEKFNSQKISTTQLKRATTDQTLAYSEGDVIQYTFFSGVNTTIVSETPTTTKAIDVEFASCIDLDKKSYKVIQIGTQWWMAENLAYLPAVSPPTLGSQKEPFYYVYDYNGRSVSEAKATPNYTTYGVLYNWPAAMVACPPGWHLPSDEEWTALTNFLGGEGVAGGKMKETGTAHWLSTNTGYIGATNKSGFSALPGGFRYYYGQFTNIGYSGYWWSSTEIGTNYPWYRFLYYDYSHVYRHFNTNEDGFSVRCVRD